MIIHLSDCTLWFSNREMSYTKITYKEAIDKMMVDCGFDFQTLPKRNDNPIDLLFNIVQERTSKEKFYEHCTNYLKAFNYNTQVYKLSAVSEEARINPPASYVEVFKCFK